MDGTGHRNISSYRQQPAVNVNRVKRKSKPMPRRPSSQPTEVELEILLVLWEHGPCPMGKIHEVFSERRDTVWPTFVGTTT